MSKQPPAAASAIGERTGSAVLVPATTVHDDATAASYTAAMSQGLLVPVHALVEFRPRALGARAADFDRIVCACAGRTPEQIRIALTDAIAGVDGDTRAARALRATLLILRDYVNAGFYPLYQNGQVALAPLLEARNFSPRDRRDLIRDMYKQGRINALADPGNRRSLDKTLQAVASLSYDPSGLIDLLVEAPPRLHLSIPTSGSPRMLWRAVRATWSMAPDASAPGREISVVVLDARKPTTPLAITQFRNVVPEIRARDCWMGLVTHRADGSPGGYIDRLAQGDTRERLEGTKRVLMALLSEVNAVGLPGVSLDGGLVQHAAMQEISQARRDAFNEARRRGEKAQAQQHLAVTKRAETVADLSLGLTAINKALASDRPIDLLRQDADLRRQLDCGLRKIWHYHMGFVALEMSICGAAPPFGPLRLGKLAASIAGSAPLLDAWGTRPLGQIASTVYKESVRDAVPNPGPLVVFTSGLYPGHSAQYTRASSGTRRWRHIGDTRGYGSFHIAPDTITAVDAYNESTDGYVHISRAFGEGASARFRAIGKALGTLGLPDVRKHDTQRPLYALPLVDDPGGVLLGWSNETPQPEPDLQQIARGWWERWVKPKRHALAERARWEPDLLDELLSLARRVNSSSADVLSQLDKQTRHTQLLLAEGWD